MENEKTDSIFYDTTTASWACTPAAWTSKTASSTAKAAARAAPMTVSPNAKVAYHRSRSVLCKYGSLLVYSLEATKIWLFYFGVKQNIWMNESTMSSILWTANTG